MERILLFDGGCAACSSLATVVEGLGLPTLSTRSLHDADIGRRLRRAGLETPDRPALLLDDGRQVRLLTGVRMRLHLARLLGPRRGQEIARLAAKEGRARRQRAAATGGVSRRRVFRGVLAASVGAVGGAILGTTQSATANQLSKPGTAPADQQVVDRLLSDPEVRRAMASFGPAPAEAALEIVGAEEPIVALTHASGVSTFVGLAAGRERVVLSMRPLGSEQGIQFLSPAGDLICTVSSVDDQVEAHPPAEVAPQSDFAFCMALCLGVEINARCLGFCECCADCPWPAGPAACVACSACVGIQGVRCARQCIWA